MSLVIAIEPDPKQAAIVKRLVRERVGADVILADSKDAALAALRQRMPDLILVSALLSPRDEADLTDRLRELDQAQHLQTLTIPLLATGPRAAPEEKGGLLAKFTKKKVSAVPKGCEPGVFAEQIRGYLDRASEVRTASAARRERERAEAKQASIEATRLAEAARLEAERLEAERAKVGQPAEIALKQDPWITIAAAEPAISPPESDPWTATHAETAPRNAREEGRQSPETPNEEWSNDVVELSEDLDRLSKAEPEREEEVEPLRADQPEVPPPEAQPPDAQRLDNEPAEAETRAATPPVEAEKTERLGQEALEEALRAARLEVERAKAERLKARRLEAQRQKGAGTTREPKAERPAAAKREAGGVEAERREAERLEAERREAERMETEAARREAERVEAERREAERRATERLEAARREAERMEAEAAARREAERVEAERREAERVEAEAAARREAERVEAEAAARREAERVEAEAAARREAERVEAEAAARREAERVEAERREAARREAERLAAERREAARREAERLKQLEAARRDAERLVAESLEAARREAQRLEQLEAARHEAERQETERLEAARREVQRLEQAKAARREAGHVPDSGRDEGAAKPETPQPDQIAAKSIPREGSWIENALDALRMEIQRLRTDRSDKPPAAKPSEVAAQGDSAPVPARKSKKSTPAKAPKSKPLQDEWGIYDPSQAGFDALFAKIEEVSEGQEVEEDDDLADQLIAAKPSSQPNRTGQVDPADMLLAQGSSSSAAPARTQAAPPRRPGLAPLAMWARSETPQAATATTSEARDHLRALMGQLQLPSAVAWVSYPTGCRIRHIRVTPGRPKREAKSDEPLVILSRKRLRQLRASENAAK